MQKINKKISQNLENPSFQRAREHSGQRRGSGWGALGLLLMFLFSFNFANAELSVLWFTKTLDVYVGDTVNIDMYIEPAEDHPVFTISNTLNYNKKKLKFVNSTFPSNWLELPTSPNRITDEDNGYLRRTAGVANGVNKNVKYLTYTFTAKEVGNATLFIEEGFALDWDNNDIGFENKKMILNILPRKEITENSEAEETEESVELAATEIYPSSLDLSGRTAIVEGEDYTFKIYTDPTLSGIELNTVKLSLLNNSRNEIYQDTNVFTFSNQKSLEFTIPKEYLSKGDYTVSVESNYQDPNTKSNKIVVSEKQVGVAVSTQTWLDKNKLIFFSSFLFIIFLAFLYHIHRDHAYFRSLRAKAREYQEIQVMHLD